MKTKKEIKCKTCNDKRHIKVNTIAGAMMDYCPDCNFGGSGRNYKESSK